MDINLGPISVIPKGEYNIGTEYSYLNLVTFDGSSFIYTNKELTATGQVPGISESWQLVGQKGDNSDLDISDSIDLSSSDSVASSLAVKTLNDKITECCISMPIIISPPVLLATPQALLENDCDLEISKGIINLLTIETFLVTIDNVTTISVSADANETATYSLYIDESIYNDDDIINISIIAVDQMANQSEALEVNLTVQSIGVATPEILYPSLNAVDIDIFPTIEISEFNTIGAEDTAQYAQIQLSTDENFENLVFDSGETSSYSTTFTLEDRLDSLTKYYIRCRHSGNILGWSEWSVVKSFTTVYTIVNPVTINSPYENELNVSIEPTIILSSFSNEGPTDTAVGTQIQISESDDFSVLVAEYDDTYTTSWTVS